MSAKTKMRTQHRKQPAMTVEGTRTRVTTRKPSKRVSWKQPDAIAYCDDAMRRSKTLVRVPLNPFQPARALKTKLPAMGSALEAMLKHYSATLREQPGKLAPHSITVHEDHCCFGVVLWPRAADGSDLDEMRDAVAERDESCGCRPIVLYPGAFA